MTDFEKVNELRLIKFYSTYDKKYKEHLNISKRLYIFKQDFLKHHYSAPYNILFNGEESSEDVQLHILDLFFKLLEAEEKEKRSPEYILKHHECALNLDFNRICFICKKKYKGEHICDDHQDYNNVCKICGKIVSTNYH